MNADALRALRGFAFVLLCLAILLGPALEAGSDPVTEDLTLVYKYGVDAGWYDGTV
ncbi:MAG: hypothetical protein JRH19_27160 [Deltaproteobacteria bacterium]|nr:hypothetical protein [Deltaproteobacteria bacterium]